ncbi:MAG: alpha/beta hydrolase [Rhodovulum sulfidophilum]|uniref:Alpha/beta hydrolase n=1 Tax=Rhodovulum sulfidophilum TaxID=35806 RepID=A0A2W5NE14_RHOSU|nr:MAG: alpha/beta hydrolase [Rhodovulum sulfidophilum]
MGRIFWSDMHEDFGTWPLGYAAAGGADYGEVLAVAEAVGRGGDDDFYMAWVGLGERLAAEGEATLARGHRDSARDLFLRASVAYGASYHPLFGAPVDPRLRAAFDKQIDLFERGLALGTPPVAPLAIPFGETPMKGYFLPAAGEAGGRRGPLLILTNGYDATVVDMFFASAVAASRRGYHVLMFDGPGQGEMLVRRGLPLRPDWETVVGAVIDAVADHPLVDPEKIALSGWSLGGLLALRAASAEPRIAALVADPGMWDITGGFRGGVARVIPADMVDKAMRGEVRLLDRLARTLIDQNPVLRWSVVQRGFWVHGVEDIGGFLAATSAFTLEGRAGAIRCPTLVTQAEKDDRSAGAEKLFAALDCPKTLLRFTAAEGAGDHCELMNRSLLNRRVLDWLDETFGRV